jgi:hypothetical protein
MVRLGIHFYIIFYFRNFLFRKQFPKGEIWNFFDGQVVRLGMHFYIIFYFRKFPFLVIISKKVLVMAYISNSKFIFKFSFLALQFLTTFVAYIFDYVCWIHFLTTLFTTFWLHFLNTFLTTFVHYIFDYVCWIHFLTTLFTAFLTTFVYFIFDYICWIHFWLHLFITFFNHFVYYIFHYSFCYAVLN